ncbi:MAG TPA: DUF1543 domain-containing protein, partial [Ferruginibacter sp.]|nr:DUF1543 domain-containing protein [Ferruginibacter sp.]
MERKLFMLVLGCKPAGRNTEQHDVFFGIGSCLKDLLPQISGFWNDGGKIHIDSWREVTMVDGYSISILSKEEKDPVNPAGLFFL